MKAARPVFGDILGGGGILMVCMLLGAVAGLILTLDRRGLMWGRRYWLAGRWYVRRAMQPPIIEAAAWYEVVEESETPIVIRAAGKTLVAPVREGGTA